MSIEPRALEFFKQILATPSPSGYETPVQEVVRDYAASFADEMRTDVHGNVVVARNARAPLRVMLAGHCDQIGLVVQYIDDDGFVHVSTIGGWDPQVLIGQRLTVWGAGGPVLGIIARKPIHLLNEEERKQVPKIRDLWLDIGAKSKEEVLRVIRVGDPITVELRYQELQNGRAVSAAMDDKTGLWVVIEALRRVDRSKLQVAAYSVSTVQEEIGLAGADQFLQRRSARGNRRGRDSRHRLPDHRKKGRGRYPSGCRAGRVSRAEYEPQGRPTAPRRRPKVRDSLPVGRFGPGHADRCEFDPGQSSGSGRRVDQYSQPIHA